MTNDRTITLFDRINLANCAMQRAFTAVLDENRFDGEHSTARMWIKYRIHNSARCCFVEAD